MSWKSIAKTVGKFAPLAGTLIGGPAGATIGALVASTLGVENTPDAVQAAIAGDPDAALKLKEMELKNKETMTELTISQFREERLDRQGARDAHKGSNMPAYICGATTVMVTGMIAALLYVAIPEDNQQVINIVFGSVLTQWAASIAYWVGTTLGSSKKTSMLMG